MARAKTVGRYLLKGVLSAVLIAGVILFLATYALESFLPPERLRALVIEHGRRALGMDVRLREVSVGWFSGISLGGLEIGSAASPFVRADGVELGLRWLALLKRELVVGRVWIGGLDLRLLRDDQGRMILPGHPSAEPSAEVPASKPPSPFILEVSFAEVSGGRLMVEGKKGDTWEFSGIELTARDARLEGPFAVRARGRAAWTRAGGAPASVVTEGLLDLAGLNPEKMFYQAKDMDLRRGPWRMDGWLRLRDFKKPSLEWRGSLRADSLQGTEIGVPVPGLILPRGLRLSADLSWQPGILTLTGLKGEVPSLGLGQAGGPEGRVGVKARGAAVFSPGKSPAPSGRIELEVELPRIEKRAENWLGRKAPKLSLPPAVCRLSGEVSPAGFDVKSADCTAGRAAAAATGRVRGLPPRSFELRTSRGKAELAEVPPFIPPGAKVDALSGPATFFLSILGPPGSVRWETAVSLPKGGGNYAGLEISDLRADARLSNRRISIGPPFEGLLLGSTFQGTVEIYLHPTAPAVAVNLSLASLELSPLFKALKERAAAHAGNAPSRKFPKRWSVSGGLDIGELRHTGLTARKVRVDYALTVSSGLSDVAGRASLKAAGGRLLKLEGASSESSALRALLVPLIVLQKIGNAGPLQLLPDLNDVEFHEISGEYDFKAGVMEVRSCTLKGPKLELRTRGTLDLPTGKIALTVQADVARLPTTLEFDVSGTVAKPVTILDKGKLLTEPVLQLLKGEPIKKIFEKVFPESKPQAPK